MSANNNFIRCNHAIFFVLKSSASAQASSCRPTTSMNTRFTLHRVKGQRGPHHVRRQGGQNVSGATPRTLSQLEVAKFAAEGFCICTARLLEGKHIANFYASLTDPLDVHTALFNSSFFLSEDQKHCVKQNFAPLPLPFGRVSLSNHDVRL